MVSSSRDGRGATGVPAFLACERIAPGEARGACQASNLFDNTAKGTKTNSNSTDMSSVISCKWLSSYPY